MKSPKEEDSPEKKVGGSLEVTYALGDGGEGLRMGWWSDAGGEEVGSGAVKV